MFLESKLLMDYKVQKPARLFGVSLVGQSASFPSAQFYKRGDVHPIQLEKKHIYSSPA